MLSRANGRPHSGFRRLPLTLSCSPQELAVIALLGRDNTLYRRACAAMLTIGAGRGTAGAERFRGGVAHRPGA